MSMSIIEEYFGEQSRYSCGYCKSTNTSYSHAMNAQVMNPRDYQKLIDRGWRRSGKYIYKPTNHLTCCPAYTIRCQALQLSLSESQKKVLKSFNRFLAQESPITTDSENCQDKIDVSCDGENACKVKPTEGVKLKSLHSDGMEPSLAVERKGRSEKGQDKPFPSIPNTNASKTSITGRNRSGLVDSGSNYSDSGTKAGNPRKAKEIRIERKKNKLIQRGVNPENIEWKKRRNSEPKSLEDFIRRPDNAIKNLSVRTVKVGSPEFEKTFDLEHELYRNYQITVHNDSEWDCSKRQFKRFLCDNPFSSMDDIYGAYHQQYYVDDVLIAVGVIDILPSCLSSVYFFYSKDHMNLSLGTFGALREVAYVRELNQSHPDIRYYYLGFYIHSCQKMRYKGNFSPSYLLCPEAYTWHLLDDHIRAELTVKKYTRLNKSPDINAAKGTANMARVLYNGRRMLYEIYKSNSGRNDEKEVQEYVSLVGASCAESMLLRMD